MELLDVIIVFLLSSIPWFLAFQKLRTQPSGYTIFINSLTKTFLIVFLLFVPFLLLALSNTIPTQNTSGSYSAEEIRQAVYLFIGFMLVVSVYISTGMDCYQMAKERYLVLNPPLKKKEVLK